MEQDLEFSPWMSFKRAGHLTGWQAAERFKRYDFDVYLDIGSGPKPHHMKMIRKPRDTVDLFPPARYLGNYIEINLPRRYPAIWCNHTLEHQPDVGSFLRKIFADLEDNGLLCVTVPRAHNTFVSGHINLFVEGTLIYNLITAGFNCRHARVGVYDRNVSVILKKDPVPKQFLDAMTFDRGDLDILRDMFPVPVKSGSNMQFGNVNW